MLIATERGHRRRAARKIRAEHVNPTQTFKIENPVAVVSTSAHLDAATAFKNFQYSAAAQTFGRKPVSGRSTRPSPTSSGTSTRCP